MVDHYSNKKTRLFLVTAIGILGFPAAIHADVSLGAALEKCATIQNDDDRLSCYDALALLKEGVAATPAAEPEAPVADPAPVAEPAGAAVTPAAVPAEPVKPAAAPAEAAAPVAVAATAEKPPEVTPLGDDFGKTGIQKDEAEKQKYSARVTRCVENKQSGLYYFYFDNGQVWKQSKHRKLRWSECEFDVIVTKATFGFDMYIPEKDRAIRVSRLR